MQKSVKYLRYKLTADGIGPQPKKIEAMDRVLPPQNNKALKRFLGMINFYREVFKRRSHILSPWKDLTAVTAKPKKGEKKKAQSCFQNVDGSSRCIQDSKINNNDRSKTSFPEL